MPRRWIAGLAALLIAACQSVTPSPSLTPVPHRPRITPNPPIIVDGWAFPAPFPLPDGAIALELSVKQVPVEFSLPTGASFGCNQALLVYTFEYDPDAPPAEQISGGDGPVWPYGYSARFHEGRAEIVSPAGYVTLAEGETGRFSGGTPNDGRFHICMSSLFPKPVERATSP